MLCKLDVMLHVLIRYMPSQGYIGEYIDILEGPISFPLLLKDNCIICSSFLVKKELVEKSNYFPEDHALKVGEDYALWLRITTLTDFAFVSEPLLISRDEPQNSMRAFCLPHWDLKANV